jgi:hypothetical protein
MASSLSAHETADIAVVYPKLRKEPFEFEMENRLKI